MRLARTTSSSGYTLIPLVWSQSQSQSTLVWSLRQTVLFWEKAAVQLEAGAVQRAQAGSFQLTGEVKRKNWKSFRGRWEKDIIVSNSKRFQNRWKFINKSWTTSGSNTSLAWTRWRTRSVQKRKKNRCSKITDEGFSNPLMPCILNTTIHNLVWCMYVIVRWTQDQTWLPDKNLHLIDGCSNCSNLG